MTSHKPGQGAEQLDPVGPAERVLLAKVSTDATETRRPALHSRAETARRWNEMVQGYSAPGSDTLVYTVPDRIPRPLGPTARSERAQVDAHLRRQAALSGSVVAGTLGALGGATIADAPPVALAAGLASAVTAVISFAGRRRLRELRKTLTATDALDTSQMTRFSRWLVARAHQATLRATEVDGGPADTADRMAEALYEFAIHIRALERIINSSSTVADTYGRLRQVRDDRDQVDVLLDAQAQALRALEAFESTAQEVVLAAHSEHAGVVSSLLDLQAEALVRREALRALDDAGIPEPPSAAHHPEGDARNRRR